MKTDTTSAKINLQWLAFERNPPCGTCGGCGTVDSGASDPQGNFYPVPCEWCEGTGSHLFGLLDWAMELLVEATPNAKFKDEKGQQWDFVGYHVDCRVMANSGVRWLYKREAVRAERVRNEPRWAELSEAAELFKLTLSDPRPGYTENSVMHCHAKNLIGRNQDQTIQPWWFGVPKFKATCLWLRGIAPLIPTNKLTPPCKGTVEYKEWSSVHRAPPSPTRWMERSRTFKGIARAIAEQWGRF